ncbi:hypothetical protein TSOC_012115 [Tetrabaena socialis]|uniref:Peptidase M3A/M3B catalytic domain-containing protein n=1 Tax=Tetrabaena socialis TaxID=47790 RepID=A0A2J7ZNU6_9CHLO|nr:hypothetical protein TSOC_012115 [Tetrabaena socialis]|eukprot:PNH01941.1 hypothetical protein TSOC_012115 [Tetrabaena socialis]
MLPFVIFLDVDKTMIGRAHALISRFWLRRVIAELMRAGEVPFVKNCPSPTDPDSQLRTMSSAWRIPRPRRELLVTRSPFDKEPFSSANITRASSGESDNAPLIERILSLRAEKAALLGFASFADLSMASKMATVDKAEALLEELRAASYGAAEADKAEVQAFANSQGFEGPLAWLGADDVVEQVARLAELAGADAITSIATAGAGALYVAAVEYLFEVQLHPISVAALDPVAAVDDPRNPERIERDGAVCVAVDGAGNTPSLLIGDHSARVWSMPEWSPISKLGVLPAPSTTTQTAPSRSMRSGLRGSSTAATGSSAATEMGWSCTSKRYSTAAT